MLAYVLRRLAFAVPLVLGVVTLVFLLVEMTPGDPVDLMLGSQPVPQEVRERLERIYGADRSPASRYGEWLVGLARGDLGWSHSRGRPVTGAVAEALPPTLLLTGSALLLNVAFGLLLGVLSAARRGGWLDRVLTLGSLSLYAMPTFWLGLMAILLFSYRLGWFPAASPRSVGAESLSAAARLADRLWHLALPAGVLGLASAAAMTRFVRAGVLEALGRDFIRAARARGLSGRRILLAHALRNALGPVINLVGLSLPILISGSLVTEVVFAWPGMGRLTWEAIRSDDVSVVLATTLLAAGMVVVGNLLADLLLAAVDPRIRLGGSEPRR